MSSSASSKKPVASRPQTPPPEDFWQKHSPGHEFPLSTSVSVFLHMSAVGLILLFGYLARLGWNDVENKPPENEVVMLAGDPGAPGGGAPAGLPGEGGLPAEVEFARKTDIFSDF